MLRRRVLVMSAVALLAACSSNHEANPNEAGPPVTVAATTGRSSPSSASATAPGSTDATGASSPEATTDATTDVTGPTSTGPLTVTGRAIAGAAGEVESGEPYAATDPFSEAVRLDDGTCVGWAGSRGGSTVGLAVGAPVIVLGAEDNTELGSGSVTASRWEDMSDGGGQWNCSFEFRATLDAPHAEFRIKVGPLAPWLARLDPTAPGTYTASVSTDASIALIPECPALPVEPDPSATTTAAPTTTTLVPPPTTAAPAPVSGWNAVGRYWSSGVRALCTAGLPVTAIARPCRPPGAGSEYITQVVDSDDPTEVYANGAAVPAGTRLTVVVATGRPCD
jgi:hypothetical protein